MNKLYLTGAAVFALLAPVAAQAEVAVPQAVGISDTASADYARGEGRGGNWGRGGNGGGQRSEGQRSGGQRSEGQRGSLGQRSDNGGQRQTTQNQGGQNRDGWRNRGGQGSVQAAPQPPSAPVVRENRGSASGQYERGNDGRGWSQNRDQNRDQNRGGNRGDWSNRNDNRGNDSLSGRYERDRNDRDWNRGGNDRNDRDWSRNDNRGRDNDWNRNDNRDRNGNWNRSWRNDSRYDWRSYRNQNRNYYRPGRYYSPYRNHYYSRISIGFYLGSPFYASNYWINDPWYYRLPAAYGSYRWIRYYDDVLLVDMRTGYVVDVIENFFW